jgi:hypothetical protein
MKVGAQVTDLHQLRKFFYLVSLYYRSRVWRLVMKASVPKHSTQPINETMARLAIEPGNGASVRVCVAEATR